MGLTSLFIALLYADDIQEKPPSADHIRVLQEAHQREHARAIRAIPQPRRRLPIQRPATQWSEEEIAALKAAMERFFREHPGEVVDLRKVKP